MTFGRRLLLGALLVLSCGVRCLAAEDAASSEYIEFRVQPELGQIVISSNWIKGTVGVNRLTRHAEDFLERGIVPCTGDQPRLLYRKAKLGGKLFETLIVSAPPTDTADDPDATWSTWVVVLVDGVRKIDCGLGTISGDDISIYGIQLFADDDSLLITATDADGHDLSLPEGVDKLDEETVITNGTLISPDDEGDDSDDTGRATPVRA